MHIIYIDDSGEGNLHIYSALGIPEDLWHSTFNRIRAFRRKLRSDDGIYVRKELHAWKFVSGRGKISDRTVTKWRRCQIFREVLRLIASQSNLKLFNAVNTREDWAFERLLNRINRTMKKLDDFALLVSDTGKERHYIRLVRKLGVYNPIPSMYGEWQGSGERFRNIPIDRIVEDPFFKDSQSSHFIQVVDFCAYALLRKERPHPSKAKYQLDTAFTLLSPICVREASPRDEFGVIR